MPVKIRNVTYLSNGFINVEERVIRPVVLFCVANWRQLSQLQEQFKIAAWKAEHDDWQRTIIELPEVGEDVEFLAWGKLQLAALSYTAMTQTSLPFWPRDLEQIHGLAHEQILHEYPWLSDFNPPENILLVPEYISEFLIKVTQVQGEWIKF